MIKIKNKNILIGIIILISILNIIPLSSSEVMIGGNSDSTALINYLENSGGIPLKITTTTETNWTQFMISLMIGSFMLFFFFGQMLGSGVDNTFIKYTLKRIKEKTGRDIMLIKHTSSGMFSQSMIDQKTVNKVAAGLNKFAGKDFDLILHTPGGDVFSALYISRMFKNYPGKIRTIIPTYAMSGGTLLSLSTDEIIMANSACLGPVDPQLGSLFKFGSAKSWDKIVKFKGKKADDSSISMAMTGEQYTKSIRTHLTNNIDFGLSDKKKKEIASFLTNGNIEHAYPLTPNQLKAMGIPVTIMKNHNLIGKLIKIISKMSGDGVTFTTK